MTWTNLGIKCFEFTERFQLEKLTKNGWNAIPLKQDSSYDPSPRYLFPGDRKQIIYSLTDFAQPLTAGTYRILEGKSNGYQFELT